MSSDRSRAGEVRSRAAARPIARPSMRSVLGRNAPRVHNLRTAGRLADDAVSHPDPAIWRHAYPGIGSCSVTGAGPRPVRRYPPARQGEPPWWSCPAHRRGDSVVTWFGRVRPLSAGLPGLCSAWARSEILPRASCAVTARDWPFIARSGVISVRTRVAVVLLPVLALAVGLSTPVAAPSPAPISAAPPPPRWMRSVSEHATAHWPRRRSGSVCPHDASSTVKIILCTGASSWSVPRRRRWRGLRARQTRRAARPRCPIQAR